MQTDPYSPLHGIRVLDASRVLAGPFCGQLLGDLGADVIKLERPGAGDESRGWGPPFAGAFSAYYLSCNRNKRAITLDLAKPEGADIFHSLLDKCDVLLENFRSDSAQKLGLLPDQLLAKHPRLIVCSISGFGRTGPLREAPGYDFAIQAMSGLMGITGPVEGPPCKVGVAVADVLTGLYAAVAVLACLQARHGSGHGYAIDLALLDCALAAQVNLAQAYLTSGQVPPRQGNAHLQIVPYQLFATADGWIVLAVGNDHQWQQFCQAAGETELAANPKFLANSQRVEHRAELVPLVEAIMRKKPIAEWGKILTQANVPHAEVWDYARLFQQEQISARGMKITVTDPDGKPIDLLGSPFHIAGSAPPTLTMPPAQGQYTEQVLGQLLGFDTGMMDRLRQQKVI
ncbi:MAG TPA: CoA transferase [Gemmataceae bacterium]|nr:CoA transferase [Gemmataceae bacterium]